MNDWKGIGRVTRAIKCQYTQNQTVYARFTLAIDKRKKENGANFIPCVVWGKNAQTMEKYIQKGEKIAVQGSIETGSFTAKDGSTVYTTEVWVNDFEFLIPKSMKDAKTGEHAQSNVEKPTASTNEHEQKPPEEHQEQMPDGWEYIDEDVPF